MSKTDKTMSTSAFERREGVENWWDSPLANDKWYIYGMPSKDRYVPPTRRWESRSKQRYVRRYWASERNRVRMALGRGEEPEPSRTRSSVDWDLY